jgi:uncharacterized protein YebE (UPF0316 family)
MDISSFIASPLFSYLILPLLIFCSRIIDVSIGTMRVIFVSKGYKLFAVVCGFFEVLVWVIAITQIMQNLTNPLYYIAYAGGFATGNYVGMFIEEKIALGNILLRVITPNPLVELIQYLKDNNYGVTIIDAEGAVGNVKILFTIVPRTELGIIVSFIKKVNPHAFYTIEDIRYVNEGRTSYKNEKQTSHMPRLFKRPWRKGK